MTYTAGVLSATLVQSNSVQLVTTEANGGVAPYFKQWYRDTSGTGFTPSGSNILTGKTALTLTDDEVIPNTVYYYKVVFTDSTPEDVAQTVISSALTVTTIPATLSQNQFAMVPFPGMVDLNNGENNIVSAKIDDAQAAALYPGARVYTANDSSGIPSVLATNYATAPTGYIAYDQKSQSYIAGDRCEIARNGVCMWLYATTLIAREAQVIMDTSSLYGVQALSSSGKPIVGRAFDKATVPGQLIRVIISTPSTAVDS